MHTRGLRVSRPQFLSDTRSMRIRPHARAPLLVEEGTATRRTCTLTAQVAVRPTSAVDIAAGRMTSRSGCPVGAGLYGTSALNEIVVCSPDTPRTKGSGEPERGIEGNPLLLSS